MATNKILNGVVRLNSAEDSEYVFTLSDNGSGAQSSSSAITVEEVFIECDTTANNITIALPTISSFNGGWSPKIFITNISGGNVVNFYSNGIINQVSVGQTAYLHIVSKTNWGGWISCNDQRPIDLLTPPSSTNVELLGYKDISGISQYNLQLPNNLSPKPNALNEYNLEECYIDYKNEVLSDFKSVFVLPSIKTFGGDRSVKIYITNSTEFNEVFIRAYYQFLPTVINEKINGVEAFAGLGYVGFTIMPKTTGWFHIVSNDNWAFFCTPNL